MLNPDIHYDCDCGVCIAGAKAAVWAFLKYHGGEGGLMAWAPDCHAWNLSLGQWLAIIVGSRGVY